MAEEFTQIKQSLEFVLSPQDFHMVEISGAESPLFMVLTVKNHKVGFATINGKPKTDYTEALESFKDIYATNAAEWADYDLTLILCKKKSDEPSDEFCNWIEVEPYFCRKFVVDLTKDLNHELKRLPFIPLSKEIAGVYKTPIDAQTFLTASTMDSNLARYLVSPYVRSADRIIKDSLQGEVGKPNWQPVDIERFISLKKIKTRPVRLEKLQINNFRAFRGTHDFDLDANLVVIFGPNGLGKTSLFDAIDFACTGSIARFEERFRLNNERLLNIFKHLDASIENSNVIITVHENGNTKQIARNMNNRKQADITGVLTDRTKTLMTLTGLLEKPINTHIDNLIHLFRASHLFGQEYQSLTSTFREDSILPEDVVSRMLAFQDYVEGINKTKKVVDGFRREHQKLFSRIAEIKKTIQYKDREIEQYEIPAESLEKPDALFQRGKEIANNITSKIGIKLEVPEEITSQTLKYWRELLTVKSETLNNDIEIAKAIEERVKRLAVYRDNLGKDTLEIDRYKERTVVIEEELNSKQSTYRVFSDELDRDFNEEKALISRRDNLKWLINSKKIYDETQQDVIDLNAKYWDISTERNKVSAEQYRAKEEEEAEEQRITETYNQIDLLKQSLDELGNLENYITDWTQTIEQQTSLSEEIEEIKKVIIKSEESNKNIQNELNRISSELTMWEKRLTDIEQNRSALNELLDSIELHIVNHTCPVCGAEYETKDTLLQNLAAQRGIQPVEITEALSKIKELNTSKSQLSTKYEEINSEHLKLIQKYSSVEVLINEVHQRIHEYKNRATAINMPIVPNDFINAVEQKRSELSKDIELKQQALSDQRTNKIRISEYRDTMELQGVNLSEAFNKIESDLEYKKTIIMELTNEAQKRQVSLESQEDEVIRNLEECNLSITEIGKTLSSHQQRNRDLANDMNRLEGERESLSKNIREIADRISGYEREKEELEDLIKRLNLSLDIDEKQVFQYRKKTEKVRFDTDLLLKDILNYEIILDKVGLPAMVVKMKGDIVRDQEDIGELEREQDSIQLWVDYYETVIKELESLQNNALSMYADQYGPLTSNIQRRLRSVYGFGDIELQSAMGGLAVRVERKGQKDLPPTDFFSESQLQIVMLGLFLSAALTQAWSSFTPILMDDPVEHFDNLNSYAFVDLIKGLIYTDSNLQFIISICDERLFQLIRQRFGDMSGKAIYHIFDSIGENGPSYTTKYVE